MSDDGEQIREQMRQVREELQEGIRDIADETRELGDWRYYVESYPWFAVAAVIAAGYLLVPQRAEIIRPDAEALEKLAEKNKLFVTSKKQVGKRGGLLDSIITLAASAAMRGAVTFLGHRIRQLLGETAPGPASQPETHEPAGDRSR